MTAEDFLDAELGQAPLALPSAESFLDAELGTPSALPTPDQQFLSQNPGQIAPVPEYPGYAQAIQPQVREVPDAVKQQGIPQSFWDQIQARTVDGSLGMAPKAWPEVPRFNPLAELETAAGVQSSSPERIQGIPPTFVPTQSAIGGPAGFQQVSNDPHEEDAFWKAKLQAVQDKRDQRQTAYGSNVENAGNKLVGNFYDLTAQGAQAASRWTEGRPEQEFRDNMERVIKEKNQAKARELLSKVYDGSIPAQDAFAIFDRSRAGDAELLQKGLAYQPDPIEPLDTPPQPPSDSPEQTLQDFRNEIPISLPTNPALKNSYLYGKIPAAIGGTLPFAITGAISPAATIAFGAAQGNQQQYEEAQQAGYGRERARNAAIPGILTGASEGLMGIGAGTAAHTGEGLAKGILKGAAEEGFQEGVQNLSSDTAAKLTYDPNRDVAQNLPESVAIGALLGGGFHGVHRSAEAVLDRLTKQNPQAPSEFKPETIEPTAPPASESLLRPTDYGVQTAQAPVKDSLTTGFPIPEEASAALDRLSSELDSQHTQELFDTLREEKGAKPTDAEMEAALRQEQEENAAEVGDGVELLDAIRMNGGLPTVQSGSNFRGELQNIRENAMGGKLVGVAGVFQGNLFRKNAPEIDQMRRALEDHGFYFETPADLLTTVEERLRSGRPMMGVIQSLQYSRRSKSDANQQSLNFDAPSFSLERQTPEQIKREKEAAALKDRQAKELEQRQAPLTGTAGDLTSDMFGEGDTPLFNEDRSRQKFRPEGAQFSRRSENLSKVYRAGSKDESGIKPFSSWTRDKSTAEAYQDNPGYGGETLREESADLSNTLQVNTTSRPGMRQLAEDIGLPREDGDEWFDSGYRYPWEEFKRVAQALKDSSYDWIEYPDDFPDGAKTIVPIRFTSDIQFSRREPNAQGFYSGLERLLDEKIQGKSATPEQVRAIIKGAKPEEVKWTRIEPAIDQIASENGGKVPKQALLDYLAGPGRVDMPETVLGLSDPLVSQADVEAAEARGDWDEAERLTRVFEDRQLGNNANDTGNQAKFANYQIPGGENYRETVVGMPDKGYKSSHFPDNPNYVSHYRTNERTDSDGNPGLFVEEIQSDRHQAGREKGYGKSTAEMETRNPIEIANRIKERTGATDRDMEDYLNSYKSTQIQSDPEFEDWIRSKMNRATTKDGIPDAPYRKDWGVQNFKRALRDAVAGGKSWIGWTSGEVQADRYDLSKQLDSVVAVRSGVNQSANVRAYDKQGNQVISKQVAFSDLAETVGKDLADKIANQEPGNEHKYSGLDLKVGGKGMTGFYDQILPAEVQKYIKRFGGKVEKSTIGGKPGSLAVKKVGPNIWEVQDNGKKVSGPHFTPQDAEAAMSKMQAAPEQHPIWRVDITPEMAASVKEGQPQFVRRNANEETNEPLAKRFGPVRPSRQVDALKKLWIERAERIAPGFSKQIEISLEKPSGDVPADAGAAWSAKNRILYLFHEALTRNPTVMGIIDFLHEAGHAFFDVLTPAQRMAARLRWMEDTTSKTGPLYENGKLKPWVDKRVEERTPLGFREWFSEDLAWRNVEWAKTRDTIGSADSSVMGRLAAQFRALLQKIGELIDRAFGLRASSEFRDFLKKGSSFYDQPSTEPQYARRGGPPAPPAPNPEPHERFDIQRAAARYASGRMFVDSGLDTLERSQHPEAVRLAKAIRRAPDLEDALIGEYATPFEKLAKEKGIKQAFKEFEQYQRDKENGRPTNRTALLPLTQKLIQQTEKTMLETGQYAQRVKVQVKNPDGTWRTFSPIGGTYWPRVIRKDVKYAIQNPTLPGSLPVLDKIRTALQAQGKSEEEINAMLDPTDGTFVSAQDTFGNLERARTGQLPEEFYDYSFENVVYPYITSFAKRMAQIAAYGQGALNLQTGKVEGHPARPAEGIPAAQNLFADVLKYGGTTYTREYIESAYRDAYNVKGTDSALNRLLQRLNIFATFGQYAANIYSGGRNIISGEGANFIQFGAGRFFKSIGQSMKNSMTAREIGVVKKNIFNSMMFEDYGDPSQNAYDNFMDRLTKWGSKVSLVEGGEHWVRNHGMWASSQFISDGIKAVASNPDGDMANEFYAVLTRAGANPDAVVAEKGDLKGHATQEALRLLVRDTQFGYRSDQAPLWAGTPTGRVVYKYGKWGLMMTRFITRNVIDPVIFGTEITKNGKTMRVRTRRSVSRLIRLLITPALVGMGYGWMAYLLGGKDEPEETLEEIGMEWDRDKVKALKDALYRFYSKTLLSGMFGLPGQAAQATQEFVTFNRVKNPTEMPMFGPWKAGIDFASSIMQQKAITAKDAHDFIVGVAPAIGGFEKIALANLPRIGIETQGTKLYQKQTERQILRTAARRFADETGVDYDPAGFNGRKNVNTPFYTRLKDSLMIGDAETVRSMIAKRLEGATPEERKQILSSIRASVSAGQPFRIGSKYSNDLRHDFEKWAKTHLSPYRLAAIQDVDRTYRTTAQAVPELRGKMAEN